MNGLEIFISDNQTSFTPGSRLSGSIRWTLLDPSNGFRLQLLWHTSGKGSTDIELVGSLDFPSSQTSGSEPFEFTLPKSPYSFSGKLISLHWALELISLSDSQSSKTEFVLSPSGKEILLSELSPPETKPGVQGLYNSLKPR